ncbi:MAG: hypothetical protein OXB84_00500, partial [Halobacteriovoraceae bacterium]|nr:hypothetical protein [Halobacteriovoraceae bacterium]
MKSLFGKKASWAAGFILLQVVISPMGENVFAQGEGLDVYGTSGSGDFRRPLPDGADAPQRSPAADATLGDGGTAENTPEEGSSAVESHTPDGGKCGNPGSEECCESLNPQGAAIVKFEGNECVIANKNNLIGQLRDIENSFGDASSKELIDKASIKNSTAVLRDCQLNTHQKWEKWTAQAKRSAVKLNGTEQYAPFWYHKLKDFIENDEKLDKKERDNVPLFQGDLEIVAALKENEELQEKIRESHGNNKYHISKSFKRVKDFKEKLFELAAEATSWLKQVQICTALIPLTAFHVDFKNNDHMLPREIKTSFDKRIQ